MSDRCRSSGACDCRWNTFYKYAVPTGLRGQVLPRQRGTRRGAGCGETFLLFESGRASRHVGRLHDERRREPEAAYAVYRCSWHGRGLALFAPSSKIVIFTEAFARRSGRLYGRRPALFGERRGAVNQWISNLKFEDLKETAGGSGQETANEG